MCSFRSFFFVVVVKIESIITIPDADASLIMDSVHMVTS